MSIWITAFGVGCLGCAYGYVLIFILRRCLPPATPQPVTINGLLLLLSPLGLSTLVGISVTQLNGELYIGPYGIGLLIGLVANLIITWLNYK